MSSISSNRALTLLAFIHGKYIDVLVRAMKPLILALPLILIPPLILSCGYSRQAQTPAATPGSHENEMSSAFREQARRAFDAVDRVPDMGSKEYPHAGFDVRELDAEKAIAEAKYKAATTRDKEVLNILYAALWGRTVPERRPLLDPDHLKFIEMAAQCALELKAEFEPEHLTELGLKTAREKTCLSRNVAILSEMERRQGSVQ